MKTQSLKNKMINYCPDMTCRSMVLEAVHFEPFRKLKPFASYAETFYLFPCERRVLPFADDNFYKQFGPRSGSTNSRP